MEKVKQDFILLIMNCQKYKEKAIYQKNTWIKSLPHGLIYYHVVGDPNLEKEYIFDDNSRVLFVKNKDDYNSLPHKVITSYFAIMNKFEYKYIFKTDDDQNIINCEKFFNVMIQLLESKKKDELHYGGRIIDVMKPHISQYYKIHPELPNNLKIETTKYCSGRFYFLSKESVKDLVTKKSIIEKEYLEDYSIGYYLDEKYKKNIFNVFSEKYFKDF